MAETVCLEKKGGPMKLKLSANWISPNDLLMMDKSREFGLVGIICIPEGWGGGVLCLYNYILNGKREVFTVHAKD